MSDPGTHLIREAIAAGVRVEPVPGANAAIAALSVSGLSTQAFTFLGFPPIKSKDRKEWFEQVRSAGHPVVFYEAPHRISATLQQLQDVIGDAEVTVARELTKLHEELVRGPISAVLSRIVDAPGEFTIVVDIGHLIDKTNKVSLCPPDIAKIFGDMTKSSGLTRRQAIAAIARAHGISANEIYSAIEAAKK